MTDGLVGAYFGENVDGIVARLLGEQLDDGGWNCEAENGSTRSSFHSTICVLRGLEYFRAAGGAPEPRLTRAVAVVAVGGARTARGGSRTPTPAWSTSSWRTATAGPAAGPR